MKGLLGFFIVLILVGCVSQKSNKPKPLYEILKTKNDGGAKFEFYELLTEPKEIKMLMNDPDLKRKIKENDLASSNFVILNMGKKPFGNYKIIVDRVEETKNEIFVYIKKNLPENIDANSDEIYVCPFSVIKINSKKSIIFK